MPRGTRQSYTDEQLSAHVDRARGEGQLSPGEELLLDRPGTPSSIQDELARARYPHLFPPRTALEARELHIRRGQPPINLPGPPLSVGEAVRNVFDPFFNNSAVGVFQSPRPRPRPRPQQSMTTDELIAADNERVRGNRALVGNAAQVIASAIGQTLDDVFPGNRNPRR